MTRRIQEDHREFRDIVSGKLDSEIKKYIKMGKMLGMRPKGGKFLINIPRIDLPTFRFGKNKHGWGRGEGKPGDIIKQPNKKGQKGRAGDTPGDVIPVGIDLKYILEYMKEALELPNLQHKDCPDIFKEKIIYNGIRKLGPESLRHNRRTMKQAMLRMMQTGEYDPKNPIITPIQSDKRYKSWNIKKYPESNAVIFFARDWSYSMDKQKCDIVMNTSWWIDCWIRQFYERTETVYIGHDTEAHEIDREKFYKMRHGGGTRCSSAFKMIQEQIQVKYLPDQWNIYLFYFSDGENWNEDNTKVEKILKQIQKYTNIIGIGQILYYNYYDGDDSLLHHIREAIMERELDPQIFRTFDFKADYSDQDMAQESKIISKFLGSNKNGLDFEDEYDDEEEDGE